MNDRVHWPSSRVEITTTWATGSIVERAERYVTNAFTNAHGTNKFADCLKIHVARVCPTFTSTHGVEKINTVARKGEKIVGHARLDGRGLKIVLKKRLFRVIERYLSLSLSLSGDNIYSFVSVLELSGRVYGLKSM